MEILREKVGVILRLTDSFDAYLDKKLPMIQDKKLSDELLDASDKIKAVSAIEMSAETVDDGFSAFSNVMEMKNMVVSLKARLDEISTGTASSMSDTYSRSVSKLYLQTLKTYSRGVAECARLEDNFKETYAQDVLSGGTNFRDIRRAYLSHPNTTELYAHIVQLLVNDLWRSDRMAAFEIMEQISEDKRAVLEGAFGKKKMKAPLKMVPCGFGLMSTAPPEPLADVLKKTMGATMKTLEKKCKTEEICCVLVSHVTNSPTKFNILPFIDWDYIDPIKVDAGVSVRLVNKMNTIVKQKPAKWSFKRVVHGSLDYSRFVILETLDGVNYSPLTPWIKGSPIVPSRFLEKFIESFKGPTRIEMYNAQMHIRDKMFFVKPPKMQMDDTKIDPKYLRNDLFNHLLGVYDKQNKIKSPAAFEKFIQGSVLPEKLGDFLIQYFPAHNPKPVSHKFGYSELVTDFLGELQQLTRAFSQEMYDQYAAHRPDPSVYSSKHRDEDLRSAFEDILDGVLQSIITDSKNVFQAMMFKDKLLDVAM